LKAFLWIEHTTTAASRSVARTQITQSTGPSIFSLQGNPGPALGTTLRLNYQGAGVGAPPFFHGAGVGAPPFFHGAGVGAPPFFHGAGVGAPPFGIVTPAFRPIALVKINMTRSKTARKRDIVPSGADWTPWVLYTVKPVCQVARASSLFRIGTRLAISYLR
jgi:hypothetical protein